MARQPRLAAAGHVHHVLLCGHNGHSVFLGEDDREAFLALLRQAAKAEQVAVHGYALLDNEVQLLLTPAEARALSRLMQAIGRRYGARFNRRHGHVGTLWSGRFRASVVEPEEWVLRCLRFIENPMFFGAEELDCARSRWSSVSHHLGLRRDPMIAEHADYWSLGNTPFERELAWRRLLEQGLTNRDIEAIRRALKSGAALGGAVFRARLGVEVGRDLSRRSVGRPSQRN